MSKMQKWLGAWIAALAILCLAAGCAMVGFERVATDGARYTALQDALDVYGEVGVARDEMTGAMQKLAAYIRGDADEYNVEVTMFGQTRMLFGEQELTHMVDVLGLFKLERAVRTGFFAAFALLTATYLFLYKGNAAPRRLGVVIALCVLALAAIAAYILSRTLDFDAFFLSFHQTFFDNDLWLMTYDDNAMIRMFPEQFFEHIAQQLARSAAAWGGIALCVGVTLGLCPRPRSRGIAP